MQQPRWTFVFAVALLVVCGPAAISAQTLNAQRQPVPEAASSYPQIPIDWVQQFVPDSQTFWDNSENWTTNYGPAYRDTLETPSQFLACSPQFALCFHSGPDPHPCHMLPDGRTANCLCTVATKKNYVLMTAILNHDVYLSTLSLCGPDGSLCTEVDQAPVCKYLTDGALIPGADVISDYDPDSVAEIKKAIATANTGVVKCDKLPYAGCMTAPCKNNGDGTANCKCPVFYGTFQLIGKDAKCSLGGDLIPSASYSALIGNKH